MYASATGEPNARLYGCKGDKRTMSVWNNVRAGLALAAAAALPASGCIGGAEASMAAPPAAQRPHREPSPARSTARFGMTSLVEYGPAGYIGANDQWGLTVIEENGRPVATLTKVAVEGRAVDPAGEVSGRFAFEDRALSDDERRDVRGTRWEDARVVETTVELAGPFDRQHMSLTLWHTPQAIAGVWTVQGAQVRGGPLLGSGGAVAPRELRDVEDLPPSLRCRALGGHCVS